MEPRLKPIAGSYLVDLHPGFAAAQLQPFLKARGGRLHHTFTLVPGRVNVRNLGPAAAAALQHVPGVARVRQDYQEQATLVETVPLMGALYDDPAMWNAFGGLGVGICLLDTGVNRFHIMFDDDNNPETPTGRIAAWRDFIWGETVAYDDHGHGSHMAGIIFGRLGLTLEDLPFQGVAPKARMMVGKVLDRRGLGAFSDVQAGIEWCAGLGPGGALPPARVINLSLGGGAFTALCDDDDPTGTAAVVNAAAAAGVLVVAAAGNESQANAVATPACASGSLAVGATYDTDVGGQSFGDCQDADTAADQTVCFSNHWDELDVVAPGCVIHSATSVNPVSAVPGCGTSQAAAHVSGLAALVMVANGGLNQEEVRARLRSTALDLGAAGRDRAHGFGRVQAASAVAGCFGLGPQELFCGDGVDGDCDGLADCDDPDCCGGDICAAQDGDGDGFGQCDCDDGDGGVWALPGAPHSLTLMPEERGTRLVWQAPAETGGTSVAFDLLKSLTAGDFGGGASCLESRDSRDQEALERKVPLPGQAFYYLVRSRNNCSSGQDAIGYDSSGRSRPGRSCP